MGLLIKWAVLSGVLMGAAALMPTVKVRSWPAAIAGAAVFGIANVLLGWLLTFVATILTLGLFGLLVPIVVNMVLLKIADQYTGEGLNLGDLPSLFGLSAVVSLTSYLAF